MKITRPRDGEPIRLVILPDGEPRYRVVLDGGPHPVTGKRRQLTSTHRTLTEARAHVDRHRADVARGVFVAPDGQTFESYSAAWLEARARRVRPITLTGYRSCLGHAVTAFGGKPLTRITRPDVERVVGQLADDGRSQRTAALTLFVLRSILGQALDDGLVVRNVAAKVQAIGTPPKDRGALPATDMAKLRAHVAGDRLHACWLLTLYGLRRSEVLGLKWPDVDLAGGTVTVERGVVADDAGKRAAETPPKTRRGARVLPLPPDVTVALCAYVTARAPSTASVTSAQGGSLSTSWASRTGPNAGRTCGTRYVEPRASSRSLYMRPGTVR